MKKFLAKLLTIFTLLIVVNLLFLFAIPKDSNAYLCEYNHKVELMVGTPQPRIILIGGSSVAFGTNSEAIADSFHCNVVNFGLHGGIGIKYPLEDCLHLVKKGDVVVLQIEYENFFASSDGEPETLSQFMMATDWRRAESLNFAQWKNTILGIPQVAIGNFKRLIRYPLTKSLDTPNICDKFMYVKSGFNDYGDEVSHFNYPSNPGKSSEKVETRGVDKDFMIWLANIIIKYNKMGVIVVMMPPVCPAARYHEAFNHNIVDALNEIKNPYIVNPLSMVLDDSCSFGGYHVNEEGVRQNTKHIIEALGKFLKNAKAEGKDMF